MSPTKSKEKQVSNLCRASSDLKHKAIMRVMEMTEDECAYILELLDSKKTNCSTFPG